MATRPTMPSPADPQRSATHWSSLRGTEAPVSVVSLGSKKAVAKQCKESSNVVFDCPPSIEHPDTLLAVSFADVVLIPVLPSPLDLWATLAVSDALADYKVPVAVILNQVEARTRLSKDAEDILDQLQLRALDTRIHRRVAYRNAILDGTTVDQIGRAGREASREIEALFDEINH